MVVCHLIDEVKTGGAQTHLLTVLRGMKRLIPDTTHVVVVLFGDGEVRPTFEEEGIPVEVLDLRPYLAKRQWAKALWAIREVIRRARPDVVETHLTWSRLLGLFPAWRQGVPVRIAFEHGDIYLRSPKFRVANAVAQAFANKLVVPSTAMERWTRQMYGFLPGRIVVLHNPVDTERFFPGRDAALRSALNLSPETTVFCGVGTMGQGVDKRFDICIEALALARARGADAALVLCGDGEQRPVLEQLAKRLGIDSVVRFLGMRRDVDRVLRACDAFCHSAPFEPFGIVCVEAMATGLPVIVPSTGGFPEYVEHGTVGFLYAALRPDELAGYMLRLSRDPALRATMGRAARRLVEEKFSVAHYAKRLYSLYQTRRG